MKNFIKVYQPANVSSVIVSIPHGGTLVPDVFAKYLSVTPGELWSDWYTSELYSFVNELNVSVVSTELSRFVADVNRDPTKPVFAPFWEGIVASKTPFGDNVYSQDPTKDELEKRVAIAYTPYHRALHRLVNNALSIHDRVLVLDLHSFGLEQPADIIIGNSRGKSANEETTLLIESALHKNGFTTQRNVPFSGGWVIRQFANNERVEAVQLEINQRTYASSRDVNAAKPLPRIEETLFNSTQKHLHESLKQIVKS